MLNTGISAVLGLGYWVVAARYYSDEAVGHGSAAIAAMKLLAGLTALTLIGAMARFIPTAGRTTRTLVVRVYALSSVLVAVAAGAFLLTLDLWGPAFDLLHGWLPGLVFVAAVVGWSLLTLQDGVLTGLRSATWVPVGNTVFSTAKLLLLFLLSAAVPAAGVFVSWAAAIALSVLPLGWLVFRRLVPRHMAATAESARPATYPQMGRFLAGDCTGALFSLAVVFLVPVLVATQVGAADNAYFYITVTIAGTVNLLALNMGASLTVEGAHDPDRLAANCRAALRRMARIMLPVCGVLFVFAPQILGIFGAGYAEAATPLLRWYAVGALLRVVVEVHFAVLRAQSRTSGLAYLQGLLCLMVLSLTLVLLPMMGLTGAGVAEVASLGVVALVAGVRLRRVLRGSPAARRPAAERSAPDGDLADLRLTPSLPRVRRLTLPRPSGALRRLRTAGAVPVAAGWVLLAVALALYWLPLRGMDDTSLDAMGGLGLVSVLPAATLLGGALLAVCFGGALFLRRPPAALLTAVLLLTVVCLHALPAVLESEPRFATAWQHLGFVDYLERTGATAPDLDARWSWPGFFAGLALLVRAAGVQDLTELIRWWPLAIQLLYLAPLAVLLHAVRAQPRAKWCAAWFFVLCGWVGQDYLSPQGFTYLLYLCFVAVLLVWFRPAVPAAARRTPGEEPVARVPRRTAAVLLVVLVALFTAAVAGHQLTPFVMLGVLTVLVLVRRSVLRGLPLLCAVLVAAWVGFLAEPYWSGHFDELFGGLGGLTGNVSSSVSGRIEGGDPVHKLVLYARVALAGGVLALAGWGLLRRRRAGYDDRCLVALTAVPFLAFGMQSYGGEMALRVFLFATPGACVLAALAFFPRLEGDVRRPAWAAGPRWRPRRKPAAAPPVAAPATEPADAGTALDPVTARDSDTPRDSPQDAGAPQDARVPKRPRPVVRGRWRRWTAPGAAMLVGLLLFGGFLVARWGNEPFERVRPGEVAAMEYVYAHDRPTARLLWMSSDPEVNVTPAMPWGARDMERVSYVPIAAPRDPERLDAVVGELRRAGPQSYLVVNRGQSAFLELDAGYPAGWEGRVRQALDTRPELRRVFTDEHAALYEMRDPVPGLVPEPAAAPPGPRITWTDWTVTGALGTAPLLALLLGRELLRVLGRPGARREAWMQGTLWFALPLMLLVLTSLVHRMLTLS
ncbi:lipopolysaccharide biosynthesis protein [Streptomyces sp. 549]|uniref:lipopolysaccharide biosynthesis protein n=1 Tax=Streptomyces sp. 549 TaxID=3049076 RepID=UPI0024C39C96|nr:lipopolysaccharide biosynthesis protein [Streptomyces sp. 549]MDK1475687.1 lipopolysaccharide biosynthesis protein [Streptomyces sp. 549]